MPVQSTTSSRKTTGGDSVPSNCPPGSSVSNKPPGSPSGIPSFTRSPETQATTQQGVGSRSQQLVRWAKQLDEAMIRPGGPDMNQALRTLADMANDPALPIVICDAAMVEYTSLAEGNDNAADVGDFLRQVQREAEATAGHDDAGTGAGVAPGASVSPGTPVAPVGRNFAAASVLTAPVGSPPPFVRGAEQPSPGQKEIDPYIVSPALRAPITPGLPPSVEIAKELILAHPDWTAAERLQHLMDSRKINRHSAGQLDVKARHVVAFGMSDDNRTILFNLMLQHAGWTNNPDFANAMANKMRGGLDAGSTNPGALRAAAQAAKPILAKGGSLADLTYENLREDIPEEHRQFVKALFNKPAGYVTAGFVSPESPASPASPESTVSTGSTASANSPQDHPDTPSPQQLQPPLSPLPLQQLSPGQSMDESEIHRLLQTPFVLPSPMQGNDEDPAESARKRQRVEGGFTTPLIQEGPMPMPMPMPMPGAVSTVPLSLPLPISQLVPVMSMAPTANAMPDVPQLVTTTPTIPMAPIAPIATMAPTESVQTPALQTVQPQTPASSQ